MIKTDITVQQLNDLLENGRIQLSDLDPADWAEAHRVLNSEVSSRPGPFKYDYTPYLREPVNCLSPNHPARIVAVMKGAQIGFSMGVIESGIGWIISEAPGNILFLSGHADLAEEAITQRVDQMIDSCGIRPLIRPNSLRTKNQRTGDTNKSKEFPGGYLVAGSASNHKLLRQRSMRYGFIDDFDAAKTSTNQAGSTRTLIEQRFAAYYDKMKLFYISTPELKQTSNIEPVYLKGDQRRYFVPCPCCGDYIPLIWTVQIQDTKEMGGISWKMDGNGELVPGSVGYVCQICGQFFDDSRKYDMNLQGEWRPTAKPSEVGYYSYHISSLYAPPGMYDWEYYVRKYIEANPASGRIESLHKSLVNLCLGETYEHTATAPSANQVQSKIRTYKIGSIPEWMSEKDGNGKIVLLTCACDLNGKEKDARLDYEVVAWAESGSNYSIKHGSIGSFVFREGDTEEAKIRTKWTYEHNQPNSVWPVFEEVLNAIYETDTGRQMKIASTVVDTGHFTSHAYTFVDDTTVPYVFGVKGDKEEKFRKYKIDLPLYKAAKERAKMYLLDVNYIKDLVAEAIKLEWNPQSTNKQHPGYMNYPQPGDGLYSYENYFKHYEAEHRTDDYKEGEIVGTRWQKKNQNDQNHFWDVRIYNYALKELWKDLVLKESPLKKGTWADFAKYIVGNS
jgi:phage terminase large subunit GpA-like protein